MDCTLAIAVASRALSPTEISWYTDRHFEKSGKCVNCAWYFEVSEVIESIMKQNFNGWIL